MSPPKLCVTYFQENLHMLGLYTFQVEMHDLEV